MQIAMKKKEEREKGEKKKEHLKVVQKEKSLVNDRKFFKAKVPRLIITKFDSTHFNWFRFWNQFESQIDKCGLPQVSKFSYLKEVVIPKAYLLIDRLPFTSEGSTRTKVQKTK